MRPLALVALVVAATVPVLRASGQLFALAEEHGVSTWHVSLTHTDSLAQAVVVASRVP